MPLSCYKFTVNHGFTGLIAYFIELMLSFIEDIADIAITIVID